MIWYVFFFKTIRERNIFMDAIDSLWAIKLSIRSLTIQHALLLYYVYSCILYGGGKNLMCAFVSFVQIPGKRT